MSFDIFFQPFDHGDAGAGGGAAMREVLAPYIVHEKPEHDFLRLSCDGGEADVYLSEDSMMVNHAGGDGVFDALVRGARAADWVIIPVGCKTCLTRESQREHLPEELTEDTVLVTTGADLLRAIKG